MQNPFGGKQPIGVIYNTSMDRPDAALALAMLYGFEAARESRMGSVCISGGSFEGAVFCDMLARFYHPGPPRNGNQELATGFASDKAAADTPMLKTALERTPEYEHRIKRVGDTSAPEAVLRNGVIFNAEAVMILSAPVTNLARTLDLQGVRDLYKDRVKRLVIVDAGAPQDQPALKRLMDEFPSPIFLCGKDVGEALTFPGSEIDKPFDWAPAHPVVDAYRAFRPMPYDAPAYDMAAAMYAVHPEKGYFETVDVSPNVKSLRLVAAKKDELQKAFVQLASTKPVVPAARRQRQ